MRGGQRRLGRLGGGECLPLEYHAGPIGRGSGPRASRANLAGFMLAIATDDGFMRMKPLASY